MMLVLGYPDDKYRSLSEYLRKVGWKGEEGRGEGNL